MNSQGKFDDVQNKVLVPVKWRSKLFHIICDGGRDEKETRLLMFTHLFPEENPYEEGIHMVDASCGPNARKRVEGEEYRYICTELVDLDAVQSRK